MQKSLSPLSFGDYLKHYRNRQKITQGELADKLNTASITVSRWERDKQIPDASLIPAISNVLNLSYLEEYSLLASTGYVLQTKMPRLAQIKEGLQPYIEDVQNDIFPSVIVDHYFTQWVLSPPAVSVSGYEKTKEIWLQSSSHFYPVFDSEIAPQLAHETTVNRIIQVKLFVAMNTLRRHENWFINYPQFIQNVLSHDDYLGFEYIWRSILNDVNDGSINIFSDVLGTIRGKPIIGTDQLVRFKQRIEIISDLPQFAIMRFLPIDRASATNWFKLKQDVEENPIVKLWDVYDTDRLSQLLANYE